GRRLETPYPAKWNYVTDPRCGDPQMTTEVSIKVRVTEDVYLVLTGFDLESQQANLRVLINPLILWVWIGFLILAFGTLVCLIPQGIVDLLSPRPKTRLGRAADVGILLAIVCSVVLGIASQAHAAPPPNAEH